MDWTPEELQAIVDEHPCSFYERRTWYLHSVASSTEQHRCYKHSVNHLHL